MEILQRKMPKSCLNPNMCVLCKAASEDINHLFLTCGVSRILWDRIYSYIGLGFNIWNIKTLYESFSKLAQSNRRNIIFLNVGVVVLWSMWKERNNKIFNNTEKSMTNIWEEINNMIGLWSSRNKVFKDCSFVGLTFL